MHLHLCHGQFSRHQRGGTSQYPICLDPPARMRISRRALRFDMPPPNGIFVSSFRSSSSLSAGRNPLIFSCPSRESTCGVIEDKTRDASRNSKKRGSRRSSILLLMFDQESVLASSRAHSVLCPNWQAKLFFNIKKSNEILSHF